MLSDTSSSLPSTMHVALSRAAAAAYVKAMPGEDHKDTTATASGMKRKAWLTTCDDLAVLRGAAESGLDTGLRLVSSADEEDDGEWRCRVMMPELRKLNVLLPVATPPLTVFVVGPSSQARACRVVGLFSQARACRVVDRFQYTRGSVPVPPRVDEM